LAVKYVTLGISEPKIVGNSCERSGWWLIVENMSSRSGHVDVNERRLRPIYGQDTFTIEVTFHTYVLTPICAIMLACFLR